MITLATLKDATAQAVFEQSARHLLKQKARSIGAGGGCMYRHPEGLMCGAGPFISQEEYDERFEGEGWKSLVDDFGIESAHRYLISHLQHIHDREEVRDWKIKLIEIGKHHKLDIAFINEEFKDY